MRIHLCGNLAVEVDGCDVTTALRGRQGRLLLAYLVVNRGEPVRRDALIDAVWDGSLPNAPDASLSSLLTGVRRTLGDDMLTGRAVLTLTLPEDAWIDIEVARATTRAAEADLAAGAAAQALARARRALELTSRPVLAEMQAQWVERLRSELAQLRCDQLETATRAALALGDAELATAERLAKSMIELEPYRESGHALLMEALARGGNVAEALLTFDRVRVMLRDELGVPPAPALTALHERLLGRGGAATAAAPAPQSASPEVPLPALIARCERRAFVAREHELRRLRERWAHVQRGHGELVLVTGEPGIGKTRLAARFAAAVHGAGGAVTYGRADEETVVPYQPIVEALRHLVAHADLCDLGRTLGPRLDELRPLLPELARATSTASGWGADADNGRHALFEAAAAVLDHVARRRPLLVVLEDIHWADKPTLLLLRQVVRHAEAAPMMVLATYRDVDLGRGTPLQRLLADLRREHVLERVSLAGFDERETAALVAARAPEAIAENYAGRLWGYTAGNPFFIEETIRSIGDALPELRACGRGAVRVPESVQDVIMRRCERLSPTTLDLLTNAAVLGRDFPVAGLERLIERSTDQVLAGLEEAAEAGLLVEDAQRVGLFSFCHALVRETIYARPAASRRQLLHLRAGTALELVRGRVEVHAAELAHHFFEGRHAGGAERAVVYAIEAGREAARAHAYEEAAAHFERALQALDLTVKANDALRAEMWLALGTVRWQGGEPNARLAFDEAAAIARRRGDVATLVRAALGAGGRFYAPGRSDPAYLALLEDALAAAPPGAEAVRARLLGRLAEALPDGARRAAASADGLRLARREGDAATLAGALLSRHAARLHVRHLEERLELAAEAVAVADAGKLRETSALGRHWLIYDLVEGGDLDGARRRHAELERLARELQQPLYQHSALAWRGVWAQLGGRFEEAERLAREGLRLAERAGDPDARAHFTAQLLPVLRDQGRLSELLPDVHRLAADGSEVLAWRAVLPLAYLEADDADVAAEAFSAIGGDGFASLPDGLFWLPATAWLAEAAARLEDTAACATLLSTLQPHTGRLVQAGFTGCWGAVDRLLGVLAGAVGRRRQAERYLDAALEQHLAIGAAPLAARTRGDAAMLAGGRAAGATAGGSGLGPHHDPRPA